MKILALALTLLLLAVTPLAVNAQDPTETPDPEATTEPVTVPEDDATVSTEGGDVTVTGDDSTVTIENAPEEVNYFDAVLGWVASSIILLLGASLAISEGVSGIKTMFLAPLKEHPVLSQRIWNDVTLYQVAVLALVALGAFLNYELVYNPFPDSPITVATELPTAAQGLISILLVTYLSSISHETKTGLMAWATKQQQDIAAG